MVAPGLDVPVAGLTAQEAARRLTTDGPNELQTERSRNLLQEAWDVICQPMIFVDGVCRHGRCGLDLSGAQGRAGACRAAGSVLAEGAVIRDGPRCASRVATWCLAMHRQPAYLVPRGSARGGGLR